MEQYIQAIKAYYDSQNWRYDFDEERATFRMRMNLEAADSCAVYTVAKEDRFTTYTVFPIKAPKNKYAEISEFINRANYGMIVGCFEMDYDDGEIRFRVTNAGKNPPDMESMERLVDMGFVMMDRYAAALLSVIYGNNSAEAAIAEAEKED